MSLDFVSVVLYLSVYIGLIATTFYILSYMADVRGKKPMYTDAELPFVSVLIPAYNEERSIAQTIDSILGSNYPEGKFEVIVVDDGSKDRTYELAKQLTSARVRVFSKKNGGKGSALNFALTKAKGHVVITMDADTMVHPESMRRMVRYFKNPYVMSVTPAMLIAKPKTLWQRIQHAEYALGLFLRKSFAALNAVYITPGAFSAYRRSFFDKYGGYDVGNITEDLEIALRIQYRGFKIENCANAAVYTIAPANFVPLLRQRRRWYHGLLTNMWKYKKVISPKYGDMGFFVIPVAWISIFFALFAFGLIIYNSISDLFHEFSFLSSVGFDFGSWWNVSFYSIERLLFGLLSNRFVLFVLLFIMLSLFYLIYTSRKQVKLSGVFLNLPLFFIFFAFLFAFWWVISIIYLGLNAKVKWR